jgi:hypothetical protein
VFLEIRVGVRQVHFAGLGADVGEGVKNVGEVGCWEVLGVVRAGVDCLVEIQI